MPHLEQYFVWVEGAGRRLTTDCTEGSGCSSFTLGRESSGIMGSSMKAMGSDDDGHG